MKCCKAAGPSGIIAEMLKAAGEERVVLARKLAEAVFPVDWEESFILNLYKGKDEALDCGNYRGLKLTDQDQVMKLLEWVLDSTIHQTVNIDEMQFAFVPGRGTIDAMFIVRQLVADENYICARCNGESRPISARPMTLVDVDGTKLDMEATFWCLGDMLCSGGGCDSAIAARCCVACGKFGKLLHVLTSSHPSPKVHDKVYSACVC